MFLLREQQGEGQYRGIHRAVHNRHPERPMERKSGGVPTADGTTNNHDSKVYNHQNVKYPNYFQNPHLLQGNIV